MSARHEVIRIESAKVATSLQSKTRPPSLVRDSSSASKIFVGGRDRKRLLFCTALKYGAKDGGVYPAKNTLLIAANFISVYSLLTASRIERHRSLANFCTSLFLGINVQVVLKTYALNAFPLHLAALWFWRSLGNS